MLVATIAVFQILQLDKAVDYSALCKKVQSINPRYKWNDTDLELLINRKIVLSKDDIRIVHLESASVIVALFFDQNRNEKQDILLKMIENSFIGKEISSLGIVWLCNGSGRHSKFSWRLESVLLTERIVENVSKRLYEIHTSEEIRNLLYLLDKITISDKKEKGIKIILDNKDRIVDLTNNADSVSASGFSELFNSMYNYDHKQYYNLSRRILWSSLMKRMMKEQAPNYYAWGKLFNRGLSLRGKRQYCSYSEDMYEVAKWVISKATVYNIEEITLFLCSVSFLIYVRMDILISEIIPVYERFFDSNTERAIYLINFDFMTYICGMNLFDNRKPLVQLEKSAKMIANIIPSTKLAVVISNSCVHDWIAVRDTLCFISYFDSEKFIRVIKQIDLNQLSEMAKNSWNRSYEISLIFDCLAFADTSVAKEFLTLNEDRITVFNPVMITVDPKSAIRLNKEKNVKIQLFTDHRWQDSLLAFKALCKSDKEFSVRYLKSNITQFSEAYSNVSAYDFTGREALDLLKEIEKIDRESYFKIISGIDRDKVLNRWDQFSGISPRKRQWVKKRKKEFFDILGLPV